MRKSQMRYLSLFSGVEAAHLAWEPLGWECAAVAEIEPAACAVLAHRLGATRPRYLPDSEDYQPARYARIAFGERLLNLGDVRQVTLDDIAALGRIDVVIGGSPCQDLSVAGRRAGLAGARSSLFHEQVRIFDAARHLCGARWLVWENVPGAFSTNDGRDFAVVVGTLAGLQLDVPEEGWGNEGVAAGPRGLVEWSVLDAQWRGVAQRRRRVFAVLDTGNWADRPPVLLEPDRLRGDSPPRREAGEGAAACAGGGPDGGRISGAVTSKWAKGSGGPAGDEVANMVAHTLRGEGFDASEDGTGRGTPLVPVAFHGSQDPDVSGEVTHPVGRNQGQETCVYHAAAVRRLTPREAERLQGMPDDWTLAPFGGKPMSDGPRYRMIGNSFAVPVIRWIGEQIANVYAINARGTAYA